MCVNEIAEFLNIPASSAALHVRVLEEAELIRTELKPGIRGSMKLCIRQETSVVLDLQKKSKEQREEVISMPVGNYVDYKITPTCGMVKKKSILTERMSRAAFTTPDGPRQAGVVFLRLSGIPFPQCGYAEGAGKVSGFFCRVMFRNSGLQSGLSFGYHTLD